MENRVADGRSLDILDHHRPLVGVAILLDRILIWYCFLSGPATSSNLADTLRIWALRLSHREWRDHALTFMRRTGFLAALCSFFRFRRILPLHKPFFLHKIVSLPTILVNSRDGFARSANIEHLMRSSFSRLSYREYCSYPRLVQLGVVQPLIALS